LRKLNIDSYVHVEVLDVVVVNNVVLEVVEVTITYVTAALTLWYVCHLIHKPSRYPWRVVVYHETIFKSLFVDHVKNKM